MDYLAVQHRNKPRSDKSCPRATRIEPQPRAPCSRPRVAGWNELGHRLKLDALFPSRVPVVKRDELAPQERCLNCRQPYSVKFELPVGESIASAFTEQALIVCVTRS